MIVIILYHASLGLCGDVQSCGRSVSARPDPRLDLVHHPAIKKPVTDMREYFGICGVHDYGHAALPMNTLGRHTVHELVEHW